MYQTIWSYCSLTSTGQKLLGSSSSKPIPHQETVDVAVYAYKHKQKVLKCKTFHLDVLITEAKFVSVFTRKRVLRVRSLLITTSKPMSQGY